MRSCADSFRPVFDIAIGGASLALAYRGSFADEVRNRGIDGLIELLAAKNRPGGAGPVSARM